MSMIIEKFKLPGRDSELDYLLSGGSTYKMPSKGDGAPPFNVFTRRNLDTVDLGGITVFCGASNTEKNLLLRIIAAKLGSKRMPEGMSERCLDDYLDLCYVKYGDFEARRETQFMLITKEQSEEYIKRKYADLAKDNVWSVVTLYENILETGALYLLEEPENGMSMSEQEEFSQMIESFVRRSGNQFIISTNSPILMGIPGAVIYDFDEQVIRPEPWHKSRIAQKYVDYLETLRREHHSPIKDEKEEKHLI